MNRTIALENDKDHWPNFFSVRKAMHCRGVTQEPDVVFRIEKINTSDSYKRTNDNEP
jgi:hypothetical protein